MRRRSHIWLGMAISLLAFVWAFYGVDFVAAWIVVKKMKHFWLIPAALLVPAVNWCRAARWRLMFSQTSAPPTHRFFSAVNISYLANNVLPLRAGDLVRTYFIARAATMSKTQALSTIVVERVIDVMTAIFPLLIVSPYLPSLTDTMQKTVFWIGILTLVAMIILAVVSNQKARCLALLQRLLTVLPCQAFHKTFYRIACSILEGLSALKSPWMATKILGWTIIIWLLTNLFPYALFQAFRIELPFSAAVFLICITSLGVSVPSSPGFIGVAHSLIVLCLTTAYSLDKNVALSFALVAHAWQYLLQVFLGAVALVQEGYSFDLVTKSAAEPFSQETR